MSRERRKFNRTRKRFRVQYGLEELDTPGFAMDVSVGGIFITANKLLPLGSKVHLRLEVEQRVLYMEGEVVRHKLSPQEMRRVDPQGMGVRFIQPSELVSGLLGKSRGPSEPYCIDCLCATTLEDFLREQLNRGVALVPVPDPPPEPATEVGFSLKLWYVHKVPVIKGQGRVVQLLGMAPGEPGGRPNRGAVLEVLNLPAMRGEIALYHAPNG